MLVEKVGSDPGWSTAELPLFQDFERVFELFRTCLCKSDTDGYADALAVVRSTLQYLENFLRGCSKTSQDHDSALRTPDTRALTVSTSGRSALLVASTQPPSLLSLNHALTLPSDQDLPVLQPDSEFDHPDWDMTSASSITATPVSAFFDFACYERDRSGLTAEPLREHQFEKQKCDSDSEYPQDNVIEETTNVAAAHAEINIERTIEDEDRNRYPDGSDSPDGPVDSQTCVTGRSRIVQDTGHNESESVMHGGERDPQHAPRLARCDSVSRTRDRIEEENDDLRRQKARSRRA